MSYTIVVANAGPSDIVAANVTDSFPSSLLGASWSCVAVNGACTPSGSGSINTPVDLATGGTATFTVNGTVLSSATGSVTNIATITTPAGSTDPNPSNNSAADTDTLNVVADLSISKTDHDTNTRPGDPITYQIVVANAGPSAVTGATVVDSMPVGIIGVSWTCTAGVGGGCAASGTGDLNELVDLGVGSAVTFIVTGTVTATTGTLTNTAQVDVPTGATDPNTANNVATDTTQVDPLGDLSITKTDGLTSAVPGAATSYTIVVSNGGPSAAGGVAVNDTLPATLSGATWTCTATPGSNCSSPAGLGNVAQLVDVAAGGTVSFLVTATIASEATGVLANTATLTPPPSFTDTNVANNSATDVTDLAPTVDLAVTKTDGQPAAVPGTPVTYSVTVTNAGPSAAVGARVLDNLPATLTVATWTCSAAPGSSCGSASGGGSIDQVDTIAVGGTVSYIISATVSPTATGVLTNTVTVTPASGTTDSNPGNNSAIDVDTLTPQANLSVVKTDGAASVVPGTPINYSIVVGNAGPSSVAGASVVDALPAALTNASWTCTGNAGGLCGSASGTGSIATTATLPSGTTVTYTVTATVSASATGVVANMATVAAPVGVTDPDTSDNSSTDVDSLTPSVDLSITKTDGTATAVAGTSTTYAITVANSGPSTATGAQITDVLPSELSGATWACTSSGGATCATPNGTGDVTLLASLPAGGSVTISLAASVDPAASGFVVNTATVTEPAGDVDTDPANNAATDSDALSRVADLSITKTDGLASALPGDAITYMVGVGNNGPSSVLGAVVSDVMPTGLTGVTWTCAAAPGSACTTPSGTGDITAAVDLVVGGSATFTINATIATSQLGTVTNTASIVTPPGVNDPNSSNNVATDTTIVNGLGDVSITKTDGVSTIVAGTPTSYTIVVTNPGPSKIDGIQVLDTVPVALTGVAWTCNPGGAAVCGTPSGFGSINDLLDMPAASTVTFIVNAVVAASASGVLSNTALVTLPTGVVDSDPTNNQATDLTDIESVADLAISKTDNVVSLTPGNSVGYDITVVNNGPSAVTGASISDVIPATISSATYTCTPSAGAACGAPSGNVSLSADLAVGASVVLHISGAVSPSATGTLVNTAVVTPPPGVTDPVAINNTATDSDALNPIADVSVAKSNGVTSQSPDAMSSYTITVANAGPSAAAGVSITDPLPSGVTTASWTCSAAAGSACATPSGTGAVNTTVDLAAAGTVTFTVSMQAGPSAGTLTNIVVATVPPGITDPDPSNNIASDTDTLVFTADVAVTKTSSAAVVAAGQSLTYTVVVADNGPDAASGVTVLDSVPTGLVNTTWTCSATPGSSCPAAGTGDISVTVDLAAGGSVTFSVIGTTTTSSPAAIVNTATAAVGPNTVDPDPTNNADGATVTVDFAASLALQKTASVATALPGDTFSYTIVVSNAGPARLDGVVISDPVPAGIVALSWTCVGSSGGVCLTSSGAGSPLLTANLPNGASVTITLGVQAALDASGAIVNVVTATAGGASQPIVAQASANVAVSPLVPVVPALSIHKTTSTTAYSAVGTVVTYTLIATNTGNATLTNVTITDPNATIAACAPVTLAPGQTLTCSASHVVTQTDLDRGAVTNAASATGFPASGPAVTATSETVVVGATRTTNLALVKTSSSDVFARAGDQITFTIVATNNGNVTLTNVTISDPNAVLKNCPVTNLAPGQTITCTAVHTVTTAEVTAKVISNQARATALPMISLELVCPLLEAAGAPCDAQAAVSAESNTVVLNRVAPLPTTGSTVVSKLIFGGGLLGIGEFLLLVGGRRRRRPAR